MPQLHPIPLKQTPPPQPLLPPLQQAIAPLATATTLPTPPTQGDLLVTR
ncbi:hypothetical protein [Synechococcus sp. PCC 7336]|nr:hypothetical protein [Synechococcus sp. PCC 7336]